MLQFVICEKLPHFLGDSLGTS